MDLYHKWILHNMFHSYICLPLNLHCCVQKELQISNILQKQKLHYKTYLFTNKTYDVNLLLPKKKANSFHNKFDKVRWFVK